MITIEKFQKCKNSSPHNRVLTLSQMENLCGSSKLARVRLLFHGIGIKTRCIVSIALLTDRRADWLTDVHIDIVAQHLQRISNIGLLAVVFQRPAIQIKNLFQPKQKSNKFSLWSVNKLEKQIKLTEHTPLKSIPMMGREGTGELWQ